MNGPDHYFAAEKLLDEGVATLDKIRDAAQEGDMDLADAYGKEAMGIWAQAQVHATLALAAATAHPAERYSGWPGAYGS